jgi:hypothetical protein
MNEEEYVTIHKSDIDNDEINVPSSGKIIIPISRAGMIAGTAAASAGYTLGLIAIQAASTTAGLTVNGVGFIAEAATHLLVGPVAGTVVGMARKTGAITAEKSISLYGPISAAIMSGILGTVTAVTVTAGIAAASAAASAIFDGGKKLAAAANIVSKEYKGREVETISDVSAAEEDNCT